MSPERTALAVASPTRDRHTKLLLGLLVAGLLISIVHYIDNVANYASYPQPGPGDPPAPSEGLIAFGWFFFTALGLVGLMHWLKGHNRTAAFFFTGYSVSGLIGFGHYTAPGAFDMIWWRQTHVVADIVCGIAIFAFSVWAVAALPARQDTQTEAVQVAPVRPL